MKEKFKQYILNLGYTIISDIKENEVGLFTRIVAYKNKEDLLPYFSSCTQTNIFCTDIWDVRLSEYDYNLLSNI